MRKNTFVVCLSYVRNLSVASSKALIQRCSSTKYGAFSGTYFFRIDVLNIFGKFLEKQQQELILSIVMSFQYALSWMVFWDFHKNFQNSFFKEHSWWDASNLHLLLKNHRTPFHPLTPGGKKGHTFVSKPSPKTFKC